MLMMLVKSRRAVLLSAQIVLNGVYSPIISMPPTSAQRQLSLSTWRVKPKFSDSTYMPVRALS